MSAAILNLVAKRALKDLADKNTNSKNPYFEDVQVYGRDGRPTGKVKQQKKKIPVGISEHDGKVLKKVRRRAYRLDMSLFNLCGIQFGWSSVVGIIPVIGDFIDLFLAWNVVRTCAQIDGGLPPVIRTRMFFNVMLDFVIGLVPFVGDMADAVFRANTRNAWVLEEYLVKKAEAEQKRVPSSSTAAGNIASPTRPEAAKTASGGFMSFFGRGKSQQADEEMGVDHLSGSNNNNNGRSDQHRTGR